MKRIRSVAIAAVVMIAAGCAVYCWVGRDDASEAVTVTIQVRDTDGTPVPGCAVSRDFLDHKSGYLSDLVAAYAYTNEQGRLTQQFTPGRWRLDVDCRDPHDPSTSDRRTQLVATINQETGTIVITVE